MVHDKKDRPGSVAPPRTRPAGRRDATLLRGQARVHPAARSTMPWGRFLVLLLLIVALGAVLWRIVFADSALPMLAPPTATPVKIAVVASPVPEAPLDAREHRWLGRPLDRTAVRDFADRTYLFGSSKSNAYRVHHGLDMVNPTGTPVHAAAAGVVVFAGKDSGIRFGPSTIPNFYGNLVLVKLDRKFHDQDVYYLSD